MNVTEVLTKARGRLEDPKMWHQGSLVAEPFDPDSAMCSIGTINWAAYGYAQPSQAYGRMPFADWNEARTVAQAAIRLLDDAVDRSLAAWNDSWDTSHADILKGFDAAIKLSRGER